LEEGIGDSSESASPGGIRLADALGGTQAGVGSHAGAGVHAGAGLAHSSAGLQLRFRSRSTNLPAKAGETVEVVQSVTTKASRTQ
jgi:hypothetical protein